MSPSSGRELWIVRERSPFPASATVLVTASHYATHFSPADLAAWRPDVGALRADAIGLTVSGDRNMVVLPGAAVRDTRLTAEFWADRASLIHR